MNAHEALNKLAKWRTMFAGWQLGTRVKGDPESDAVRDHREVTILLRAEVSALAALLIAKGVFSTAEWDRQLVIEAEYLNGAYEQKFPGCHATELGMSIDVARAASFMKDWRP